MGSQCSVKTPFDESPSIQPKSRSLSNQQSLLVWEKETTFRRAFTPRQGSNHSKKVTTLSFACIYLYIDIRRSQRRGAVRQRRICRDSFILPVLLAMLSWPWWVLDLLDRFGPRSGVEVEYRCQKATFATGSSAHSDRFWC